MSFVKNSCNMDEKRRERERKREIERERERESRSERNSKKKLRRNKRWCEKLPSGKMQRLRI